MASYSKEFLTGSVNGRGVKVVQTATAGTLLHTAHATSKDEVYLWLTNTSAVDVVATFEVGGVTAPDDNEKIIVPANETVLALAGQILSGALVLRCFAGTANVLVAFGFVNRIT